MKTAYQIIEIHRHAPEKPVIGQACNGCGVCCAAEPCPLSLALLWPHQQPCRALEWNENKQRYYCGMVIKPAQYLRFLPDWANRWSIKIAKRWIAADQRCDSDVILIPDN